MVFAQGLSLSSVTIQDLHTHMSLEKGIFEEFFRVAGENPHACALTFIRAGKWYKVSYSQLAALAGKLAMSLTESGISCQDKVCLMIPAAPEWPIAFLAAQYLGCISVPVDISLSRADTIRIFQDCQVSKVICMKSGLPEVAGKIGDQPGLSMIPIDCLELLSQPETAQLPAFRECSPDDTAAIFYTSGTSGTPKGVMLTHANICSNAASIDALELRRKNEVFISMLPLYHAYPFMVTCIFPLLTGSAISYPSGLSSLEIGKCINETKVTVFAGVPRLFVLLKNSISEKIEGLPCVSRLAIKMVLQAFWLLRQASGINIGRSLMAVSQKGIFRVRLFISGGSRLDPELGKFFFKLGFTVLEGYGLTETSPVVTLNPGDRPKIGSVGKPLPSVQVSILDPDENGLGEVIIKGPNVSPGYYNKPAESALLIKDGWLHSGDLGFLDSCGYLHLEGRKDEVIALPSGKKVNLEEIEDFYRGSPLIKDICVFAGSQESGLTAVIIPREKAGGSEELYESIKQEIARLSSLTPGWKHIGSFFLSTTEFPRTALGKLQRARIKEQDFIRQKGRDGDALSGGADAIALSGQAGELLQYLSKHFKRVVRLTDNLELDLGLDSLGRVELLMEIQEYFNLEIPEELSTGLVGALTVRELLEKVKPYLKQ